MAQPWLQVLHDGEQNGIGRRRWKPEQKARATQNRSNDALAVAVLDFAERQQIITPEERYGILVSTATRYLANPTVRRAMGISSPTTSDSIQLLTDEERFQKVVTNFTAGLLSKKLHSRSKTPSWLAYAAELEKTFGAVDVQGAGAPPISPLTKEAGSPPQPSAASSATPPAASTLEAAIPSAASDAAAAAPTPIRSTRPTRAHIVPPDIKLIPKSAGLIRNLNKLQSHKLSSLYHSLTAIRLDQHPALLTAGAWVFLEVLTAVHGRLSGTDFVSYLSSKFGGWGIRKDDAKDFKLALEGISKHGNAEKHSPNFTALDANNLHNYFKILEPVFINLTDEVLALQSLKP